jgi:hypothetical protein
MKTQHYLIILFLFLQKITLGQLLAPNVSAPISPCNKSLYVTGQLPNAEITIYVNRLPVVSQNAGTGLSIINLPQSLNEGDSVTVTQKVGNIESPQSGIPIAVQAKPTAMPMVTFNHVYGCGTSICLKGAEPGADLVVSQGGMQIGKEFTIDGSSWINLNKNISIGQPVVVSQAACGISLPVSTSPKADPPPNPLPAPLFLESVIECQPSVAIGNVIEGAHVQVFVDGILDADWNVAPTSFRYYFNQVVKKGMAIKAVQSMAGCVSNDHLMMPSPDSKEVITSPLDKIQAPLLQGPLCSGAIMLKIDNLLPGALVSVYVDDKGITKMIGQGIANDVSSNFWVPSLSVGNKVSVSQQLCKKESIKSNEVTVDMPNISSTLPSIVGPVFECASTVSITGVESGSIVYIESDNFNAPISNYIPVFTKDIAIDVAPVLVVNDHIWVVIIACNGLLTTTQKIHVDVHPSLTPPSIVSSSAVAGSSKVAVNCQMGSWVDIYDGNNNWLGTTYSGANSSNVEVALNSKLVHLQILKARQRICNGNSEFGLQVTVQCPPDAPTWNGMNCEPCPVGTIWDGTKCKIDTSCNTDEHEICANQNIPSDYVIRNVVLISTVGCSNCQTYDIFKLCNNLLIGTTQNVLFKSPIPSGWEKTGNIIPDASGCNNSLVTIQKKF